MPRLRKCFIHNTLVEVCFRAEEGLPLAAKPYIKVIFRSILARAQSIYPVTICHFIVMANHVHMLLVVQDPGCIDKFVGYLKRELAHAINRLLGNKKHTVWCDGYDSPIILDAEKAKERITYIYTNPQTANLVEKIEEYPNLSSWEQLLNGTAETCEKRIYRDKIKPLPAHTLSLQDEECLAAQLIEDDAEEFFLFLDPDAWMKCFPELEGCCPEAVNHGIIQQIREKEQALATSRTMPVFGALALRLESIYNHYKPKKRGKRMSCLASSKEIRIPYLSWLYGLFDLASKAIQQIILGDKTATAPPGMFLPGGLLHANLIPSFTPIY